MAKVWTAKGYAEAKKKKAQPMSTYKKPTTKGTAVIKKATSKPLSVNEKNRRAALKAYKKRTTTAPKGTNTVKKIVAKAKKFFKK